MKFPIQKLFVLSNFLVLASCQSVQYVLEGKDVTLKCRVPRPVPRDATMYWLGPGIGGTDNYAVDGDSFDPGNQVNMDRSQGIYDLTISRVTYERNNGLFKCRVKGHGSEIHSSSLNLTVLIKPGSPIITPLRPSTTQGHAIRLTCSSKGGSPDPEIFWYRRDVGGHLPSVLRPGGGRDAETTSVLSIVPTKEDHGQEFMCEVRNRALSPEEKMVASVKLNVDYYPIVTITPSNPVRVIRGEDVVLNCDVDAKPPVQNVRWMRGGAFVGTSPRLTLNNVGVDDAGRYICQADNNLGRLGEAEVTLDVLYPPTVSVPPPREVQIGGDAIMMCNVSSNPAPDYVYWSKLEDPTFRQKTEYLRLTKISPAQHGTYVCHAVSEMSPSRGEKITLEGNATTSVSVRHAPGDSFILPTHPVAVEAKSIVLTCKARPPGYPDTKYRWWRDGSDAMTIGENFTIPVASQEHRGEYHCQPFNSLGNGTVATTNLRVFEAPQITEGLKPTAVYPRERTDLRLSCRAAGDPKPVARWFKDGHEIKQSDGLFTLQVNYSETGRRRGYEVQSVLVFEGPERIGSGQRVLRPDDRGLYECIFENEAEKVASSQLVRIKHPPALAHVQSRFAYDVGDTAVLVCRMRSFPEPSFEWTHDNNVLKGDPSRLGSLGSSGLSGNASPLGKFLVESESLGEDLFETRLTIRYLTENDYGPYNCRGQNEEGPSETVLFLQAKGLPGPPQNGVVTDAGPDFLEVTFDPGFDGGYPKHTNHSIKIEHHYETSQGASRETVVHCGPHTKCHIAGLRQDTPYRLYLFSRNPQGQSTLSGYFMGRTLIDPSAIPAPIEVFVEPTSGGLVLSVPETTEFGPLSFDRLEGRFEVKYGEAPWAIAPGVAFMKKGTASFDLGPLTNGTRVRARLCTVDSLEFCGPYQEASHVSELPRYVVKKSVPSNPLVVVVTAVVVALGVAILLAVICCCYRRRRSSGNKKKSGQLTGNNRGMGSQQAPPPPYYTVGLDNKGMDGGSLDPMSDPRVAKGNVSPYGDYGPPKSPGHPQQHYQNFPPNAGYLETSYAASNHGGSVNSQDSLWQIKGQGQGHFDYQGQPRHPDYSSGHVAPPHSPNPQPHHMGYPYPHQYGGYDDYAGSYPRGVDPYGMQPPEEGYDLSGIPDPYLDPNYHGVPQMSPQDGMGKSPHTFDESLESGVSTPNSRNRRVIREIIV